LTNYTTYSDEQLVGLLKINDEIALKEIYNKYWNLLFTLAAQKLNNTYDAEDTVQQIFIDLWQRRKTLEITRSLNHYLAAAVKYRVLNILIKRSRQPSILYSIPENTGSSHDEPYSILEFQQLQEKLELIVEKLPGRAQLIFRLSRNQALSNRQIAQELGISEKGVEIQITRALSKIRECLGDVAMFL
jgi:RNA polymerase sigma-70 factor (family 1)